MDASLRRIERDAVVICLSMAGVALVAAGGRPGPAAGVLGGGLLIGVSYWLLKGGVTALADALGRVGSKPPKPGKMLLRLAGRYALLAFLAYVMIARLRLHPVGLLAGASSVVAAIAVEAVRLQVKKSS